MTMKSPDPQKKSVILTAGITAVGLVSVSALSSKAMQPDITLMDWSVSILQVAAAYIPLTMASRRVLDHFDSSATTVFDKLAKTSVGKVMGRFSSGRWTGSLLSAAALTTLGMSHPELAQNLTDPQAWKAVALPALGVLALVTFQRGLDEQQSRQKENAELSALSEDASTPEVKPTSNRSRPRR